jgi:hypothetical protein
MQRLLSISLALAFVFMLAGTARCAPPRPRPYAGCGVCALKTGPGAERSALAFYQDPGLARIAELDAAALPRLAGSGPEPLLAVSERRGGWLLVAYDDGGREGWTKQARSWRYLDWREYLPGRLLRILPGMKKEQYTLGSKPDEGGAGQGSLTRDQTVKVLQVEGDWVRLQAPAGWFRWRDGDGRLTVSLQDEGGTENR